MCIRDSTRINTELKSLKSNLKLVESEFDANAKSVEALSSKGEALNKLYEAQTRYVKELEDALQNAKDATGAYAKRKEELTKKIEENNKALEELRQTTADTADEQGKLEAEKMCIRDRVGGCVVVELPQDAPHGHLLYLPTMNRPRPAWPHQIVAAMAGALLTIEPDASIAIPGLGTGIGGLDPITAAKGMRAGIEIYRELRG